MQINLQLIDGHYRDSYYEDGKLALIETLLSYVAFFITVSVPAFIISLPGRALSFWRSLSAEQSTTAIVLAILVLIALVTKVL